MQPEGQMRYVTATLIALAMASVGCPASSTPTRVKNPTTSQPTAGGGTGGTTGAPAAAGGPAITPPNKVRPERLVWAYLDGVKRAMDIDEARSFGFTIVDLSDDWVPYIFWDQTPGKQDHKPNRYQQNYIDLANDRINVDGAKLGRGIHNYHEVYGIPPSLSVVRRRFIRDEGKACFQSLDRSIFSEYHGPVRVVDPRTSKRLKRLYISARATYRRALRAARVRTLEELLRRRKYARAAKNYRRYRWQWNALLAAQKRLDCEGMYRRGRGAPRSVKPGVVNWAVRNALRRFERKHNIYGWGMIFSNTATALGRSAREGNYESLKRAIVERVVSAAGILEDGTRRSRYRAADGTQRRVSDLITKFGKRAMQQLGLTDADKAFAWIKGHTEADLKRLLVAVKLPAPPPYYSDQMDLNVVIDRGDVWYDLPFDKKTGKKKAQPRAKLPALTLFVKYNNQKIPLVRWRTTIGGWQKEKRQEQEYYKYKISDVGPRIWKNIIAGPVWVPPKTTPTSDLVKFGAPRGRSQRVVSQSAFGPGYASAYGLVAAFHVTKGGRDNQVRTHGTVNYMSVRNGFSHGCHRLYNFRAVRLFSFVLRHRAFTRRGQTRLGYVHRFEHKGEAYQINIHTRGYYYELTPPVPVRVLEGRIRGKLKKPVKEYVKKPSVLYNEDLKKLQKGRGKTGAPRKTKNPMADPQVL